MSEQEHLQLSRDDGKPVAERFRHLAAHYVLERDMVRACQALHASHTVDEFMSLEDLAPLLGRRDLPIWLISLTGTRYPADQYPGETVGQQYWADHHAELMRLGLGDASRLHAIVMNIFLGFYGFAVQGMLLWESRDDPAVDLPWDPDEAMAIVEAMQPSNTPHPCLTPWR